MRPVAGCLLEQGLGDLGVGLDLAEIQLAAVMFAQGLFVDLEEIGDVGLLDPVGRHCLDGLAGLLGRAMRRAPALVRF